MSSPVEPHDWPQLGAREFDQIRRLMETQTGVHLTEAKSALVMARLGRRLRELRLRTYREYLEHLAAHAAETEHLIDRLLTNETRLFREGWQFDYLDRTIIPLWRHQIRARPHSALSIWSAACSTGEEPASLAAAVEHRLPSFEGYRVNILATDLSTRALLAARALTFSTSRAADIPGTLQRHFEDAGAEKIRLSAAAAKLIRFEKMNLLAPSVPAAPFDLILCRNVLIYFSKETKRAVIDRLWRALKPGGFLFVGHAESLVGLIDGLRPVKPAIYRKPEAATR